MTISRVQSIYISKQKWKYVLLEILCKFCWNICVRVKLIDFIEKYNLPMKTYIKIFEIIDRYLHLRHFECVLNELLLLYIIIRLIYKKCKENSIKLLLLHSNN